MKVYRLILLILALIIVFALMLGCDDADNKIIDYEDGGNFYSAGNMTDDSRDDGAIDAPENGGDYDSQDSVSDAESETGDQPTDPAREIIESDIYKQVGDTLYVLNRYRGLIAIDISDPTDMEITGRAAFKGIPLEMYVHEGRAVIMVNSAGVEETIHEQGDETFRDQGRVYSEVIVVDIDNPNLPVIMERFRIFGNLVDNRMVGEVVYVVASQNPWYRYWCDRYVEEGQSQIVLMSVNVADPDNIYKVDEEIIEGNGHAIYVTTEAVYIAESHDYYWDREWEDGYDITYFDISDPAGQIERRGTFKTTVYVADRWKMHQQGDTFFAVGQTYRWSGNAELQSFNVEDPDNVVPLGRHTVVEGQDLYATRYEGDRLYAVTYLRVDPLHVIDISDPANMFELGQLEVPGWSTHIEIRGIKFLAVGVDDTAGRQTKISLYDVADPNNPTEMSVVSLGEGYSSSEANEDWKAFKIFDELGLILLPTMEWSRYWSSRVYRLHLVDVDLETGLTARGHVDSRGPIRRGVVLDDYIASIGDLEVIMVDPADRDNPEILSTLRTAHHVGNLHNCGGQLCSNSGSYHDNALHLTTYSVNDKGSPIVWESPNLENNFNSYGAGSRMINMDDKGYILSFNYGWYDEMGEWNNESAASVHRFSYNGQDDPDFDGSVSLARAELGQEEYYYYSSWWNAAGVTPSGALAALMTQHHWGCVWDGEFHENEDCWYYTDDPETGEWYYSERRPDSYYMSYSTHQAYVYDITGDSTEMRQPVAIGGETRPLDHYYYYGYDSYGPLVTNGNNVWVTDCVHAGYDANGGEMVQCFAQSYDVSDPAAPVAQRRINIPGQLVAMSDDGNIFYSLDRRWHYEEHEGEVYPSDYNRDLVILALNDSGTTVRIIKRIPIQNNYNYYYDEVAGEESHMNYRFSIQDKVVYVIGQQWVYYWDACMYGETREFKTEVDIYDAATGDITRSHVIDGGNGALIADGGGILVTKADVSAYISYNYRQSNEMVFIYPDAKLADITLPPSTAPSSYDYYYGYYYSNSVSGVVRTGDTLHIARGWDSIAEVTMNP